MYLVSCITIPGELLRQHFPGKISSELRSWRPITWDDYEASPATQHLREARLVTPQHLLFLAVFERKQGEMASGFYHGGRGIRDALL